MPFTLSHPAAVLPLLRPPFVPMALVAGAMAPDVPYFLGTLGVPLTAGDWYEPFLNATTSHSPLGVLTVSLPVTLALVAGWLLLRRPLAALLPPSGPPPAPLRDAPDPGATSAGAERVRRVAWLLLSALVGIATHLLWDSFTHFDGYAVTRVAFLREPVSGELTVARLLQHLSTVAGLALLAVHLRRRRDRTRGRRRDPHTGPAPLTPIVRRTVIATLALAALLGAVARPQSLDTYREVIVYDMERPITREDADGDVIGTTYPARTETAPWTTVAEGVLSDGAKGAGASLAAALALYAACWHLRRIPRWSRRVGG